jgi:hypothetical protein
MKPMIKKVRAWAVYDQGKIAWWQFTKANHHCDVYLTKENALIAKKEWEESSGDGFSIVRIEIRPLPPKRRKK